MSAVYAVSWALGPAEMAIELHRPTYTHTHTHTLLSASYMYIMCVCVQSFLGFGSSAEIATDTHTHITESSIRYVRYTLYICM